MTIVMVLCLRNKVSFKGKKIAKTRSMEIVVNVITEAAMETGMA